MLATLNYHAFVGAKRDCVVFIDFRIIDRMRAANHSRFVRQGERLVFIAKIEYYKYVLITEPARKYKYVLVSITERFI